MPHQPRELVDIASLFEQHAGKHVAKGVR
jgi:hypothetical protein